MSTREQIVQQNETLHKLQEKERLKKYVEDHLKDYATTICVGVEYDCEHWDGGPPRSARGYQEFIEVEKESADGKALLELAMKIHDERIKKLKEQAGLSE